MGVQRRGVSVGKALAVWSDLLIRLVFGRRRRRLLFFITVAMLAAYILLAVGVVPIPAAAQSSTTSTYNEPGVPTGLPVVGKYNGALRPQLHFSPPKGFMNDPNGMFVDVEGTYHLYYQYNPTDTIAGNQHWGHATSSDLYHWINQPIALYPSNSSEGIFSGSAVVDVNNTSGFFPDQTNGVVAIYTINNPYQQSQALAYSFDNGYTFTKYSGNPVLTAGSANFRDPKVIWHAETEKWIMIVAYSQEFALGIFTSPNLVNWTHASNFSHHGLLGNQWECPNMLEMPMENSTSTMYLLYISINPGAPQGGSIGQYYPGNWNGTHFTAVDSVARIADFGKDNYAGQFFYGIPGNQPQVSIDWASNWQYTNFVPTGPLEGWQSAMSLPRRNFLKNVTRTGYDLVSAPYGLEAVMPEQPLAQNADLGNGTLRADFGRNGSSGAILLAMNITNLVSSAAASANFTFSSSVSGERLAAGVMLAGGEATAWMDRGKILGFENPFFTDKVSATVDGGESWDVEMVVDRSVWEVFLQGGEKSATMTFFPKQPLDTVVVKTGGVNAGAGVSVKVWELKSAWAKYENGTGYVTGNNTAPVQR